MAQALVQEDSKVAALVQLRAAYASLNARLGEVVLRAAGISLDAFEVLEAIHRSEDKKLRLGDLAQQVSLTRSGLTRRLDKLEKEGLIRRESCPTDRRGAVAIATERGATLYEQVIEPYQEAVRTHFGAKITEGEAKQLTAVMRRVIDGLNQKPVQDKIELR
jgi:DNA-binding MarR family transcriptional regulator